MSVSSAGQGLRPGVVTSTTHPTNPYLGQIIYETNTGYLRVWDGSAWDYLSQKQDDTVGLGPTQGLVFIKSQTIGTTVSTVTVSNCFSSTYDSYRVVLGGGVASADGSYLRLRFDAGSTTNYYGSLFYDLYSGTNTATARISGGAAGDVGITSTENVTTAFDVVGPNLSKRTHVFGTYYGGGYAGWFGFQTAVTTQYTDLTFLTSSPTLTGGVIAVFGYRKS
jgi:hypothetical protein